VRNLFIFHPLFRSTLQFFSADEPAAARQFVDIEATGATTYRSVGMGKYNRAADEVNS
jgi:hypothetical protein